MILAAFAFACFPRVGFAKEALFWLPASGGCSKCVGILHSRKTALEKKQNKPTSRSPLDPFTWPHSRTNMGNKAFYIETAPMFCDWHQYQSATCVSAEPM